MATMASCACSSASDQKNACLVHSLVLERDGYHPHLAWLIIFFLIQMLLPEARVLGPGKVSHLLAIGCGAPVLRLGH